MPKAIANEIINPCITLAIPAEILPSIISVSAFINGTPGIRNNTEVAKASSALFPIP